MRIYDTLSRTQKDLTPLDGKAVRMYVCGVTPYSESHVGHALKSVVFDALRRYLEWRGTPVNHVENFTDIDDKLIERANNEHTSVAELAAKHSEKYLQNLKRLNVLPATSYPRATEEMPHIIEFIEGLVANGYAYPSGGDVYYRVRKKSDYGQLSGRNIDDLLSGARVEPGELKEDPLDFALWKAMKPGEPSWESPWGRGRPGWHIECSAMARGILGDQIDIHGGGADLIFPHHENEIAQSEAFTGKAPFANIWVHCALLQFGDEKMSKSVGNVVSLTAAVDRHGPDALRMLFLQGHYRSPTTYSDEAAEAAATGAERLRAAAFAEPAGEESGEPVDASGTRERFIEAMDDDLNTPRAMAALFDLSRDINRGRDQKRPIGPARQALREMLDVLGFPLEAREKDAGSAAPFIDLLVELRRDLRTAKQFELADRVRDRLTELGIEVQDSASGSVWSAR